MSCLGFNPMHISKHSLKSLPLAPNMSVVNVCNILYKIMFDIPARHFTSARAGTRFGSGRHGVSSSESTRCRPKFKDMRMTTWGVLTRIDPDPQNFKTMHVSTL